jgi:hypothetical protein
MSPPPPPPRPKETLNPKSLKILTQTYNLYVVKEKNITWKKLLFLNTYNGKRM